MMLRGRAHEPAERRPLVAGNAVAVEQQLPQRRLRLGMAGRRRLAKERRALLRRTGKPRGDLFGRQVIQRQKPTFSVPNTVRPAAMVA